MINLRGVFIHTIMYCLLLLLVGCSANQQQTHESPKELLVTVDSDKNPVKVYEAVKITANVNFGNKDISKDTKIDFEFIENGVPMGSIIPEYEGDGNYSVETIFSTKGQNQVVAHVYYEDFHEMPKVALNVVSE